MSSFDDSTKSIISGYNKSGMSADAYADEVGNLTKSQKAYFQTVSAGEATMEGLAKSMAKPTTALGKLGRTVLSSVGSMGIDLLVSTGIQLAINAWQDYANRQEEALNEADAD